MLLRDFVAHCDKFKEEHKSVDGDDLNVSSMLLSVGLVNEVWIVLQDAPLWFHCHPKHWITKHMMNYIHKKDDKMRKRIKIFMLNGMNDIKILQSRA